MTDTTTPAAGGTLDNWETSQPTGTTPCPNVSRHLDAGAKFEPGDRIWQDGVFGTAIICPTCLLVLAIDLDDPQPGERAEATDAELIVITREQLLPPEAVAELEARRAARLAAAQAGLTSAERHRARAMLADTEAGDQTPAPMAGHGLDAVLALTERIGGRGLPPERRLSALDPDQRARAVALQVADDVLLVREDATTGDLLALADYIVTGPRATDSEGQ